MAQNFLFQKGQKSPGFLTLTHQDKLFSVSFIVSIISAAAFVQEK